MFECTLASSVPAKPPKPPSVKKPTQAATTHSDLPVLSSVTPKLHHLCNDRPRRLKNRPVTRPTTGLTHAADEDDDEDEDADVFFASSAVKSTSDRNLMNGELDKT